MKFNQFITVFANLYTFLKKIKMENYLDFEYILDNNFPEIASRLQTYAKKGKLIVSGTNGKQTSINILNQILKANHNTFFTNNSFDLSKNSILTSLILELSKKKYFDVDDFSVNYYTMYAKESELAGYFNTIRFDYLLLTNLFDDQNDYENLELKKRKIQEALILNSKVNLIINADEPMFFKIDEIKNDAISSKKRTKFYYGFNNIEFLGNDADIVQKNDIVKCPVCGCDLDYKKRFYSHIGHYECACGFKRPKLDLSANAKIFPNYSFLEIFYQDNKLVFKLPFGGMYNAYNALGAIAVALFLGIDRKTISAAFEKYTSFRARDEILRFKNKDVKIKLIKNPTSLSESLAELYGAKNTKAIFVLNDFKKEIEDTSWIWDANFNALKGFENKIYITGNRLDDMALRLKYAGVNPCLMIMDTNLYSIINCCYYDSEEKESILILTVPSEVENVYKVLNKS